MKNKWSISLLTLFNVGFVSILVLSYWRKFDRSQFIDQLHMIPCSLMIVIAAINTLIIFFYGIRLTFLLEASRKTSVAIASVGYAANNLLPFRLGEVFRVYFAKKKFGIAATRTLAAMVFERVSDLFSIACLSFMVIFLAAWKLPIEGHLLYFALLGPIVFLIFGLINSSKLTKIICHLIPSSFFQKIIQPLYVEFKQIMSYQKLVGLTSYTVLIWIFTLMVFYIYFKGVLPHGDFTFLDATSLTVCTALSLAISTLPASIGLFEGSIVYFLHEIKHIEQSNALALAIILHLLIVIPQCLSMIYFLMARNKQVTNLIYDYRKN